MERGGFSSVSRPFSLHNLMRSIFVPLRLDAAARGLDLETSLDTRVDELAQYAAFPGEQIDCVQEGDGMVMGDEMRLRQIIGNLISNACSTFSAPSLSLGARASQLTGPIVQNSLRLVENSRSIPSSSTLSNKSLRPRPFRLELNSPEPTLTSQTRLPRRTLLDFRPVDFNNTNRRSRRNRKKCSSFASRSKTLESESDRQRSQSTDCSRPMSRPTLEGCKEGKVPDSD